MCTNHDGRLGVLPTPSAPLLDPVATTLKTAQDVGAAAPTIVHLGELPFDRLKWLPFLVTLLMIGVVIKGPQPRRVTNWGAFWVTPVPFNAGIPLPAAAGLALDRRMNLLPEHPPGAPASSWTR